MIQFLNMILLCLIVAYSQLSQADLACSKEMNQALRNQDIPNPTKTTAQSFSIKEYERLINARISARDEFEQTEIQSHIKTLADKEEGKDLSSKIIDIAVERVLGRRFKGKPLGYEEIVKRIAAFGKARKITEQEVFRRIDSYSDALGNLFFGHDRADIDKTTDKRLLASYQAYKKTENDFKYFLTKYDIREEDGFDYLYGQNVHFDKIMTGEDKSFRAFLEGDEIRAYEISKKASNNRILVHFKKGSCAIDQIVFNAKGIGPTYYTPSFCANLSSLDSIRDRLPKEDDPNEYKFRCWEQGASDECRCLSDRYINPWADSCYKVRRKPVKTTGDKFEEYSRRHRSLPGMYFSQEFFDLAKVNCEIINRDLKSAADEKPAKTYNSNKPPRAVQSL